MALVTEGFDLADTTTLTTGNTNFDTIAGTWAATTARFAHGSASAFIDRAASTDSSATVLLSTDEFSARLYLYLTAAVNADTSLIRATRGGLQQVSLFFISTGYLRLSDTTGTLWTSAAAFPLNQWVRVELHSDSAAGTAQIDAAYYLGDSATAVGSFSTSTGNTGTGAYSGFTLGLRSSAYATDHWIDSAAWNDGGTALIGPVDTTSLVYALTASYTSNQSSTIGSYVVDASASSGATTLTQTGGTTATVVETTTDVWTITNPGGSETLTFNLAMTGATTRVVTIARGTSVRPAILTRYDSGSWG